MSLALTHFAFGALCATLLLTYFPVRTRYEHPIMIASGVWAMGPDFWRVTPVGEHLVREVSHSVLGNVFWLHPLFDSVDAGDSYRLAAVIVGAYFLVAVIRSERRHDDPVLAFGSAWE